MKNKEIIIAMACSKLEAIEGSDEDSQREFLVNMLTSLKMQIKRSGLVHPPPPIKHVSLDDEYMLFVISSLSLHVMEQYAVENGKISENSSSIFWISTQFLLPILV